MNSIHFRPNVPQLLKIADPQSDRFNFDSQTGMYETTDSRTLILPRHAVEQLNGLELQPGEEVKITKFVAGHQGRPSHWVVELAHSAEMSRAEAERTQEAAEPAGARPTAPKSSPIESRPGKRERRKVQPIHEEEPSLFDLGTGTYGPAPARRSSPKPPEQIPWNVAFREVAAFVAEELRRNNLQWGDVAQKNAVCTILIAESKKGRIGPWER